VTGNSHLWWVRSAGAPLAVNGIEGLTPGPGAARDDLVLLAGRDWMVATAATTIEGYRTADLQATGELWPAVEAHLARLLTVVARRIEEQAADLVHTLRERQRVNAAALAAAARTALGVVGVAGRRAATDQQSPYALYRQAVSVLRLCTERSGTAIVEPADRRRPPVTEEEAVRAVARSSAVHLRDIRLPRDWWRRDLGPLIGWRHAGPDEPSAAAVLLYRKGRYHAVDPYAHTTTPVDRFNAGEYAQTATQAQPPLPAGTSPGQALRRSARGGGPDSRAMLLAGALAATLSLAAPVLTGIALGRIAAEDSAAGLQMLAGVLVAAAVVAALAGVSQNLRLLRLEGLVEQNIQVGLWDRLIRLPVRFFRASTTGELANAVLGISFVREALSGLLPQLIFAIFAVLADLALVFVVSPPLGLCALAVVATAALLIAAFGTLTARRQRVALAGEHRAAALTNQMLGGISKIKLAAAEDRAYARWAETNAGVRRDLNRVRHLQALLVAVGATLPIAGQLLLFAMLAGPLDGDVSTRRFLVINAAFALLLGSLLTVVVGSVEVMAGAPRLEVLGPILRAEPERRPDRVDPGDLRGDLTVANVTFGYQPDAPVLDDVSLRVRPGEFVAIVGPSGCGKSTLLRLLLGFEQARSGAILYDDQDLGELDVQAVRRQCGVVLQDGLLFAGSLRENICGAGNFKLEQVWEAARMAGLDADVERLPMGMNTMVPFGGGTLSVGQRQRVLIARALIHRPRIVFFDEATSALDNRTQHIVATSTRQLAATRIIIAHRLSTIVDADRIVVLDRGRVVQEGTYDALIADRDGQFHRLARRQILTAPGSTTSAASDHSAS
jgi:NHLM bacteriocin system ABC transporter ATP-binding protein